MSSSEYERLSKVLRSSGHELVSVKQNLVDMVWKNQPEMLTNDIVPHIIKYSGIYIFSNTKAKCMSRLFIFYSSLMILLIHFNTLR